MGNEHSRSKASAHHTRTRAHSFSNHTRSPAMYNHLRAPSPGFPVPQVDARQVSPGLVKVPSSPGGFIVPPAPGQLQPQPVIVASADRGAPRAAHRHEHRHSSHSKSKHHSSHDDKHAHHSHTATHHTHTHHHKHHSHSHSTPAISFPVTQIPAQYLAPNAGATVQTVQTNTYATPAPVPSPHVYTIQMPPAHRQYYGPETRSAEGKKKQTFFQYSQCTGRKKALCIGINYRGSSNQLHGCINDAKRIRKFLIDRYNFDRGDIVLLSDDGRTRRELPTRQNMIDAMYWLVKDARPHDSLFFHYSGHGGQTRDLNGDEEDGYDEVIYPLDWKKNGHIVDDDLHKILVNSLPAGCRLTAIFDSCHSGSVLDLPYMYDHSGKIADIDNVIDKFGRLMVGNSNNVQARRDTRIKKTSPADVILWSGCKDSQTSADTYEDGAATGAMSYAFMTVLKEKPEQSYQELLLNIRKILAHRFSQKPQLSSSHPMDTNLKFIV